MKKYIIGALLLATIILIPSLTNAQSVSDLQREIQRLTLMIAELQKGQVSPTVAWCASFETNLGIGASGENVKNLRIALGKEGFNVDTNSGYYDEVVAAAVSGFQLKYKDEILTPSGLTNPTGYFGAVSRKKMNQLYGCGSPTTQIPTLSTPSLNVSLPNGGEHFVVEGTSIGVKYNSVGIKGQKLSVYLYSPIEGNVRSISSIASNSDGINFPIDKSIATGQYKITLCAENVSNPAVPFKPLCDSSDDYFTISNSFIDKTGNNFGNDLSVMSFELNEFGPKVSFCNSSSFTLKSFPVHITINGVVRDFDMEGHKRPKDNCGLSHQWEYETWGFTEDGSYKGTVKVDPKNIYKEVNENNNSLSDSYSGEIKDILSGDEQFTLLTPKGGEVWLNKSSQKIRWDGSALTKNGKVHIVLDNNVGYKKEYISTNDGSEIIGIDVPEKDIARSTLDGDIGGRFGITLYGDDGDNDGYDFYSSHESIFYIKGDSPAPDYKVDLKVNGSDGSVSVAEGQTVTASYVVPSTIDPLCFLNSSSDTWSISFRASGSYQIPIRFGGQTEAKLYLRCETSAGQLTDSVKLLSTSTNPPVGVGGARIWVSQVDGYVSNRINGARVYLYNSAGQLEVSGLTAPYGSEDVPSVGFDGLRSGTYIAKTDPEGYKPAQATIVIENGKTNYYTLTVELD